jgi:hypothetical protein
MWNRNLNLLGLCVVSLTLLTSCSNSPSLDEQTKLVEYDNCLDYVIAAANQMTSTSGTSSKFSGLSLPESYNLRHNYENGREFSDILALCDEYRP